MKMPIPRPGLPAGKVSRNPAQPTECKPVGMAIVSTKEAGVTTISCGWFKRHPRVKVREESAQRHLDKKHGGQGLWL